MTRRLEVPGPEAVRFLRSLPRGAGRGLSLGHAGRTRAEAQPDAGAAGRCGWAGSGGCACSRAWPATRGRCGSTATSRPVPAPGSWCSTRRAFHLVVSPEVSRGFSGEGQVLSALAGDRWTDVLPRVQAALRWETRVDPEALAPRFALNRDEVDRGPGGAGVARAGRVRPGRGGVLPSRAAVRSDAGRVAPSPPEGRPQARGRRRHPGRPSRRRADRGVRAGHGRRASGRDHRRRGDLHVPVVRETPGRARTVQARARRPDRSGRRRTSPRRHRSDARRPPRRSSTRTTQKAASPCSRRRPRPSGGRWPRRRRTGSRR